MAANNLVPPKLKIYTDGGFPDVEGFSLGNLEPEVIVIGEAPPAPRPKRPTPRPGPRPGPSRPRTTWPSSRSRPAGTRKNPTSIRSSAGSTTTRPRTSRPRPSSTSSTRAKPGAPGTLVDAISLKIGKQGDQSFNFDLPDTGAAELEVRIDYPDDLPLDNRAYTLIGAPRKAQILVVTAGNRYLVDTLRTPLADRPRRRDRRQPRRVTRPTPPSATSPAGRFDLVIYDRFRPETPPEANTLYFGALPPGPAYEKSRTDREPDDPRRQRLAPLDAVHPRDVGRPGPPRPPSSTRRRARPS